ncbi:hypothetical protein HMPREF9582_02282 [Cutibacterium acnes HL060PA1]|nr:hypothetical protein HMPREF9603_00114 [Cutibacterium acnes HL001PA1]EFT66771.1 hypothetical protein HMPREF9582_02282 [Cutibacterium acnes HL060PA1]
MVDLCTLIGDSVGGGSTQADLPHLSLAAFRSRCQHSEFLAMKFARPIARTAKNKRS